MTQFDGLRHRRQFLIMIQSLIIGSLLLAIGSPRQLHAKQSTSDVSSVISQQLLDQVDQLLATEYPKASHNLMQGMGPLVLMAEQGKMDNGIGVVSRQSQSNLKVTAIPLPDAFTMSLLLLAILFVAYLIRRVRLTV